MLFIYVSLRYQSQLARICPEIVDSFKSLVVSSARKNGGVDFAVGGATLCCFDERTVGFSFSASRTIADIRAFLAANRVRIREYFIVSGVSAGPVTGDTIGDVIAPYTALIVPDECVLVTKEAMVYLGPYIIVEPVGNTGLMSCVASVVAEADARERSSSLRKRPEFSFHAGFVRDPVQVFRNLAASAKSRCSPDRLTPEERDAYEDTAHALEMYSRSRFDPNQSEFRIGACLDHFVLFFRAAQNRPDEKVPVTIYGTKPLPPSFDVFLQRLDSVCSFIRLPDPECLPFDLKAMPDDLLELTWLVYRAVQFLDADEFKPFFADMGKNDEFSASLGIWLYSFGILADPDDFTSIQSAPYFRIESRLGERTKKLDRQLAQYLWKRHGEGFFLPSFAFADVLDRLSLVPPDSFLVSCLYQERDADGGLSRIRGKIVDPETASAVELCAEAWKAYGSGDLQTADAHSRTILHSFQRGHVLAGEYRALTLVALVCLARNNPDDAIVYLEFARENAEAMHDPGALLATRFETAVVHFILGNYHVALCTLDTVDRILVSSYAKDWLARVLFLRARVSFELGDYRNSEALFASAADAATASQTPEAVPLCDAWRARSLVYQNRFASGQDALLSSAATIPEIPLFLMEACVLSARSIEGFSPPERLPTPEGATSCRCASDLSWASGFAMAEDRCFVGSGEQLVASRMYDAFRAYWESRSVPDSSPIVCELASLARAAADLKDPNAGIYYFLAYDVASRDFGNRNPDAAGYLSRAFKYLQKRANAIDDNAVREQYMQTPVWNGRLYRAARENMLI